MSTNFDERQAFEDLHKILNLMHELGGEYYDAWQSAEKNLSELKTSYKQEVAALKREHEQSEQRLRESLDDLQNKFNEQEEIFRSDLKACGDYNLKLTESLKTLQKNLEDKKDELDEREEKLAADERELETRREELDRDRKHFDADKERITSKLEAYDELQKKVETADEDKSKLRAKISELENLNATNEKKIKTLTNSHESLQQILDGYKNRVRELEGQRPNYGMNFY